MNTETVNLAVGRTLRDLRKAAQIKQVVLAKNLGLPQSAICRIEHGYQPVTVDRFIAIANACGATPILAIGKVHQALKQEVVNDA
jgi:transcriptional regulator with XRE-family HTH domain